MPDKNFNHGDIVFYLTYSGDIQKAIFSETWEYGFSYVSINNQSIRVEHNRLFSIKKEAFDFYLNKLIETKKFYESLVCEYNEKIKTLNVNQKRKL